MMSVTLILGGARSGKSRRAEALACSSDMPVIYVATSPEMKEDMAWQQRIEQHRLHRPQHWQTIEEPLALVDVLRDEKYKGNLLLVDCLTLWLSNLLLAEKNIEMETAQLCEALEQCVNPVILVSNEVGMGLVPETPLGREFRDVQGRLNQAVAAVVDRVEFVAAGLPICLKGELHCPSKR